MAASFKRDELLDAAFELGIHRRLFHVMANANVRLACLQLAPTARVSAPGMGPSTTHLTSYTSSCTSSRT